MTSQKQPIRAQDSFHNVSTTEKGRMPGHWCSLPPPNRDDCSLLRIGSSLLLLSLAVPTANFPLCDDRYSDSRCGLLPTIMSSSSSSSLYLSWAKQQQHQSLVLLVAGALGAAVAASSWYNHNNATSFEPSWTNSSGRSTEKCVCRWRVPGCKGIQ